MGALLSQITATHYFLVSSIAHAAQPDQWNYTAHANLQNRMALASADHSSSTSLSPLV